MAGLVERIGARDAGDVDTTIDNPNRGAYWRHRKLLSHPASRSLSDYSAQLLALSTSISTGTEGPSTSGLLSTSSIPSIIAFLSQTPTPSAWSSSHSITISSCTARIGTASGHSWRRSQRRTRASLRPSAPVPCTGLLSLSVSLRCQFDVGR